MKAKSKLIVLSLLGFMVIGSIPVFAFGDVLEVTNSSGTTSTRVQRLREQSTTRMTKEEREDKIAEIQALRGQERCDKILDNMSARVEFYDANHARVVSKYREIGTKMQNAIELLKAASIDTTVLEGYLVELADMLSDLSRVQAEMVELLRESQSIACDDTATLKANLNTAKELLGQMRAILREKKSFIKSTIVPELRSLTSSLPN